MEKKGLNRRDFLKVGGMSTVALTLGTTGVFSVGERAKTFAAGTADNPTSGFGGYGPLVQDPNGMLDLPKGFHYKIISREGDLMTNGSKIPGAFDGMAAFEGPNNTTILVRNHELSAGPAFGSNPYDANAQGGTTALVVGANREVIKEYVTSSGTIRNCAGGATPWGTWLTCEENRSEGHGYVFEVDPQQPENELSKTPIKEMGRFSHEACAIDPSTGYVYLTEDASPSYLYRFIPNDLSQKPGSLQKGGTLYAAAIEAVTDPAASNFKTGQTFKVVWKKVDPHWCREEANAQNCIKFSRLEGAFFQEGVFWFDDTSAGEKKLGRVYRYVPHTNTLELFFEGNDAREMEYPDNICCTPWGDLWFVEDGSGQDRIMGVTPEGKIYPFAANRLNDSEFAGPTFSLDGNTLFVNIQTPGITFAIWGPFQRRNSARAREMSFAAPKNLAPQVSEKVAKAAKAQGMSILEAAAFERHGVNL